MGQVYLADLEVVVPRAGSGRTAGVYGYRPILSLTQKKSFLLMDSMSSSAILLASTGVSRMYDIPCKYFVRMLYYSVFIDTIMEMFVVRLFNLYASSWYVERIGK